MRFTVKQGSLVDAECDVLVVNLFEGVKEPAGATKAVDEALDGRISRLIKEEEFEGKLGESAVLHYCDGIPAQKIILVGLGKQEEFDLDKARKAAGAAAKKAAELSAGKMSTVLHGAGVGGINPKDAARVLAEGSVLGSYKFTRFKTQDVKPLKLEEVEVVEMDESKVYDIGEGLKIGSVIAEANVFSRDLANEPGNEVTPMRLADEAVLLREQGIDVHIYDVDDMREMGMRLVLAVAKGSEEPPKFIVMKYAAEGGSKTVALVGKGVTFDTGGISIKPSSGMEDMKDDMTGAGSVIAAMRACAELKPKVNVLGIVAAVENMVSGRATRPGDVVKSMDGKYVEINNTDAEGRLTLADAITYAAKEGADEIVDIATLTGACVIALGRDISGIMGNNQEFVDRLIKAGDEAGEKLWQLPLHPDYKEALSSTSADLKNAPGRDAGTITAGLFIQEFCQGKAWAHIDIAGPCNIDRDTILAPKGPTGVGVRTLLNYLMQF